MPAPARPMTTRAAAPAAKAAAFTHGRKMTMPFAGGDVGRGDLERVEAVPVAGVAGRRGLVAEEVDVDEGDAVVEVEGDVADADARRVSSR